MALIMTGYFPTGELSAPTTSKVLRNRTPNQAGSKWEWVDSSVFLNAALSSIMAAMARDAGGRTSGMSATWFGPHTLRFEGDAVPAIPDAYIQVYPKTKSGNRKAWSQRKRTGAIILHPHSIGSARCTFEYGETVLESSKPSIYTKGVDCGLWEANPPRNEWVLVDGWWYNRPTVHIHYEFRRVVQSDKHPLNLGFNLDSFTASLRSAMTQLDGVVVTSALAETNAATLDVLTTVAESRETLVSVAQGLSKILRMYKEARQKAFRIYNKAKRSKHTSRDTALKSMAEAMDAVTKVWMTYRYAIMPEVYTIEDIFEYLQKSNDEYVREAEGSRSDITLDYCPSGWSLESSLSMNQRCVIKRRVSTDLEAFKLRKIQPNLFVTAWELTPLSFVVDWVFNVGEMLQSLLINPAFLQEGTTYSWRLSGTCVYVHDTGAKVTVEAQCYRRILIDPRQYCSLAFRPEMNVKRYADSISLIWGAARSAFKSRS